MATEFNTGTDTTLNAAVKARYEQNSDTNAFSDAEKAKLAAIEANATADQTGAEIVGAIDAELGGTTWQTGGGGTGGGAVDSVNGQTGTVSLDADDIDDTSSAHKFASAAQLSKLDGVATGATANTGALADLDSVDTAQIADGAVTFAKQPDAQSGRIIGRASAGAGSLEALTAADVLGLLELGSTDAGKGAALIGIDDLGGLSSAGTVAGALQQILNTQDDFGDIVTEDQAAFVKKSEREVLVYDARDDADAPRPSFPSNKTVIWFNHGASQPANMGQFDIAAGAGQGVAPGNIQTGTSYTLALDDAGRNVDMNNAAANTVTIPPASSVDFPIGTVIFITQYGTGQTTIAAGTDVTLNGAASKDLAAQYSGAMLRKIGGDAWIVQGDIV